MPSDSSQPPDPCEAEPTIEIERPVGASADQPAIEQPSVVARLEGLESPRYLLGDQLGKGGTGLVLSALDQDLSREVAIKLVHPTSAEDWSRFVQEARITAKLEHPHIVPAYDVGRLGDEGLFLTMRRFRGSSLGDAIRRAIGDGVQEAMPEPELVDTFRKVCDAVNFAHHLDIVHQDIKPDNIMIGAFGEVQLIDWGAASPSSDLSSARIIGTPQYMSPMRARGEPATAADDVYALGASLFRALLLRHPITADSAESFWQKKQAGEYDLPTESEMRRVSRPLVGIAMRAMGICAEPYSTAAALARELADYQAGRAVWGTPFVVEDFESKDFLQRWQEAQPGQFEVRDGKLISRAQFGAMVLLKQRLGTGVAIEYDAEYLPDAAPGDLSVVWSPNLELDQAGPEKPLKVQLGAFGNLFAGIESPHSGLVQARPFKLEFGRCYRVRVEIDSAVVTLLVDGELICQHTELFPISSGYIGLYAYYPKKAFSRLRVYVRGMLSTVKATAVGDGLLMHGHYEEAALHYRRVSGVPAEAALCEEAIYKEGLCYERLGRHEAADQVWRRLEPGVYADLARLHLSERCFQRREYREALAVLTQLIKGEHSVQELVLSCWSRQIRELGWRDRSVVQAYILLRRECFASDKLTSPAAATALMRACRWEEVLEYHGDSDFAVATALIGMGRFEEALRRFESANWVRSECMLHMGRYDELARKEERDSRVLSAQGLWHEELRIGPKGPPLLWLGRPKEVLAEEPLDSGWHFAALRQLGRVDEAAQQGDAFALIELGRLQEAREVAFEPYTELGALYAMAIRAAEQRDVAQFQQILKQVDEMPLALTWDGVWLPNYVLLPFCRSWLGEHGSLRQVLEQAAREARYAYRQKLWYAARFILGQMDEVEFDRQPTRAGLEGQRWICQAIRVDWQQDIQTAAHHYATYLNLPPHRRFIDSAVGDPVVERFAAWRLRCCQDAASSGV